MEVHEAHLHCIRFCCVLEMIYPMNETWLNYSTVHYSKISYSPPHGLDSDSDADNGEPERSKVQRQAYPPERER